jgi:hypothetical protein
MGVCIVSLSVSNLHTDASPSWINEADYKNKSNSVDKYIAFCYITIYTGVIISINSRRIHHYALTCYYQVTSLKDPNIVVQHNSFVNNGLIHSCCNNCNSSSFLSNYYRNCN